MEIEIVDNFNDFQKIVFAVSRDTGIYRGVKDSDKHSLITSLGRAFNASGQSGLGSYEKHLFTRFKERALPYLEHEPRTDLEWLALAQHHGLPTRLLDWSYNSLVALYFATLCDYDDPSGDAIDSAVYIYRAPSKTLNSTFTKSPFKLESVMKYRPSHFSERIVAQRSVFTLHNEPRVNFTDDKRLSKIVIKKESKFEMRESLRRFGVGAATLFPGLDGVTAELVSVEG